MAALAVFLELLNKPKAKGLITKELIEETGLTKNTVTAWLSLFEKQQLIYISGWRKTNYGHIPEWSWGYKMYNVPKPLPIPKSEVCKQYRLRKRNMKEQNDTVYRRNI